MHTHVPEEISVGGLIALGASGGLVPCPSALVLLLTSVAMGRVALGLTLLTAFSAGLAVVLTAVGLAVLYAKQWLPDSARAGAQQGDAVPAGGQRGVHRLCRDRDDLGFAAAGALSAGRLAPLPRPSPDLYHLPEQPRAANTSSTEGSSLPPK